MPPILARIIDTLPDYRHDHLVLMTAWVIKIESHPNKQQKKE